MRQAEVEQTVVEVAALGMLVSAVYQTPASSSQAARTWITRAMFGCPSRPQMAC